MDRGGEMNRFEEATSKADQLKFIMTAEAKYAMQRAILATLLLGLKGR